MNPPEVSSIDQGLFWNSTRPLELSHATLIHVEPKRVYDALTTSDGLDAWFTSGARVDAHPGGEIYFRWVD